jgi:hypothetical protein
VFSGRDGGTRAATIHMTGNGGRRLQPSSLQTSLVPAARIKNLGSRHGNHLALGKIRPRLRMTSGPTGNALGSPRKNVTILLEVEAVRTRIPVSRRNLSIIRRTERHDKVFPEIALVDLIVVKGELARSDGQGLDGELVSGHGESIENTKYRKREIGEVSRKAQTKRDRIKERSIL